jgi:hypothetical protein
MGISIVGTLVVQAKVIRFTEPLMLALLGLSMNYLPQNLVLLILGTLKKHRLR